MLAGFGKQTITIGSAPDCDIRLPDPGIAPIHARILNQGGQLVFVDEGTGQSFANWQPLAPGSIHAFDFRTPFMVGQAQVPNNHPAIALMLMQVGMLAGAAERVVLGADAAQAHLVIRHPSVSGQHATIDVAALNVTDHGSAAGTWLLESRLAPGQPTSVPPDAQIVIGAIPLPVALIVALARALVEAPTPSQRRALADPVPSSPGAAAGAAGSPASGVGPARPRHKTIIAQVGAFGPAHTGFKTIGRTPGNDIVVDHPQVSSKHARLYRAGSEIFLEDCGSSNGTHVRGQRIPPGQRVPVANGEKIFIGPMPLLIQVEAEQVAVVVEDAAEWAGRPLYEIEAWDLVVQVPDRDNPGQLKTLLEHVSFKAMPGDLIALMGPSGAGKTTLLLALNGYLPPSAGQVRINGENVYAIYDALRGSIGYVPQDDIVHPELTVYEAVRYSAKFRLPPDYSEVEIDRRVSATLAELGLESVAHLEIGRPERKILSGGQRKRVNIAMELVTDPVILFLDEPTSGLAADDTTALVQLLSDLAKTTGKTIICTIHQPAKDEYEKFNLALILGQGGIPMFYGPTVEAYRFFGSYLARQGKPNTIDNPRDMFDMLNRRERPIWDAMRAQHPQAPRFAARQHAAREWRAEFFDPRNPVFSRMFSGSRAVGAGSQQQVLPRGRRRSKGHFSLLFSRYLKVKRRDVSGTVIMLAQAPIIGFLLALVFGVQEAAIPYWCLGALQQLGRRIGNLGGTDQVLSGMQSTTDHAGAIFFLVVSAVWFGTSNAAREIVSERAIYLRERMVNLTLFNYLFSKFLLLSFFCVIQCSILLGIVFFTLGFHGDLLGFGIQLGTMIVTAMNSVALGLLISTMVTSSEAAMALTPIALIPQVVLGGLMVPMTTNWLLEYPMYVVPARWGFQGLVAVERMAVARETAWVMNLKRPDVTSADDFVLQGKFECATAQLASPDLNGAWGFTQYESAFLPPAILIGMSFVLLMAILLILKRRDPF
jgi:ABC transport system ATP-binding/permease protein